MTKSAIRTMVLLYLGFFSINYVQYQLSPLAGAVMAQYAVSPARFAAIFAAPALPGMFLALPSGLISDCFGIRRVLVTGLLISAAGMVWRVFSNDAGGLFGSMLLLGVSMSCLYSNYAKAIRGQVGPERVGMAGALVLSASSLGMLAGTGTTVLLPGLGAAYLAGAVLLVATFLSFLLLFQGPPPSLRSREEPAFADCLRTALRCRGLWLAALAIFLVSGVCTLAASLLPAAVADYHHITASAAGGLVSVLMAGNLTGALLFPLLVQRRGGYRLTIAAAALVYGACVAWVWMVPVGWLMRALFFLGGAALGGLFPLLLSLPALLPEIGATYGGTGGGLLCTLQMLGALVLPAWVVIPLSGDSYQKMFLLAGALLLIVPLLALLLPRLPIAAAESKKGRN